MRILLVNNSNMGGVEYYRMMMPNHILSLNNPEFEFTTVEGEILRHDELTKTSERVYNPATKQTEVVMTSEKVKTDDYLKQFDVIHFCRQIDAYNQTKIVDRLNRLGIPFGLDLDDYWYLPEYHLIYDQYKHFNTSEAVIQSIKAAHFVTCTTPIIAKEIEFYNKNVFIIENGIDTNQESWQPDFVRKERLRFGFFQGSTHLEDIRHSSRGVVELYKNKKYKDKFQIILMGFMAKPDEPSPFIGYEWALTDRLKVLNEPYQAYLKRCVFEGSNQYFNEPYVRVWQTEVDNWGFTYNLADVSVIPLLNNRFNRSKSELKLIEAGVKGKAVIVSETQPYKLLANDSNSFLAKKPIDFYNQMKYCINNPNAVEDKAMKLREDVLAKYTLDKLTDKRKELYLTYKK